MTTLGQGDAFSVGSSIAGGGVRLPEHHGAGRASPARCRSGCRSSAPGSARPTSSSSRTRSSRAPRCASRPSSSRRSVSNLLGVQLPTVLTITHSPTESVARLGGWLSGAGLLLDVRSPYDGSPLPSLRGFAGLLVMGGAMGAYDDDAAPWLPATRDLLRAAVAQQVPTLGICLGGQLLAAALGGQVKPADEGPEFGPALVAKRDVSAGRPAVRPGAVHPGRAAVALGRDHRAAGRGDAARVLHPVREPGLPGRRDRVGPAVPHRDDAGHGAGLGRGRPGPAGRGRAGTSTPRWPAGTWRRCTPTSRRSGSRSRPGSPRSCACTPSARAGRRDWLGRWRRPSGGCCGWPGSASPTPSGPAPCSGRRRTASACGPTVTRPTTARPRSSPRSAGPPTPTSRCSRCPGSPSRTCSPPLRTDPVLRSPGWSRCSARAPRSATTWPRNPADWRLLTGPPGLPDLLRVVGADPADPPTGTRGGAGPRQPARTWSPSCGRPTGGTCSCWPPATWPARSASTRSVATLADPRRPHAVGRPRGRAGRAAAGAPPRPGWP